MRAKRLAGTERMRLSTTVWFGLWALALLVGGSGCVTKRYLPPNRLPYETLSTPYRQTQLKASPTLHVLGIADTWEYQLDDKDVGRTLLTQSNVAVALSGQSDDTFKTWVNLVVFDQARMTARRKHFFCSDERAIVAPDNPRRVLIPPRRGLIFDSQCVLPSRLLTTPYATEEARLIAVVRWLGDQFSADVKDLTGSATDPTQANELVSTAGMIRSPAHGWPQDRRAEHGQVP